MFPTPFDGVYAATKVFERYFSESFDWECKYNRDRIDTMLVYPGYVATNNARLDTSLLVVDSDYFCQHVVSHMGHDDVSFGTPI